MDLAPFKEYISKVCGLRFDDRNGEQKLGRLLRERMRATNLGQPANYLDRLVTDPDELQDLIELLTVNETYFFREAEQIRLLTDSLVPRFIQHYNGRDKVRILSAACASGEEPYSLAIALFERYGESMFHLCRVNGVDIDSAVLAKAEQGIYGEFSFRGVSPEIRTRYFNKAAAGWQVKEDIRSQVSFQKLNLLAPDSAAETKGYDIIFCRNVSIYFDEATRRQIQRNLASLMKENGILIVGMTETIANNLGVLAMVEDEGQFYFVKGAPPLPEKSLIPKNLINPGNRTAPARKKSPSITSDRPLPKLITPESWKVEKNARDPIAELCQMVRDKQYDQVLPLLEDLRSKDPDDKSVLLLMAYIGLNRKQFSLAQALALQVLELDDWNIDALVLLGMAAKWSQQPEAALSYFKQAVYVCHTCWPAHYYLAELYNHSGAADKARREYRITMQQVKVSPAETGIKVIPLDLPRQQMPRLCEYQLEKLAGSAI